MNKTVKIGSRVGAIEVLQVSYDTFHTFAHAHTNRETTEIID